MIVVTVGQENSPDIVKGSSVFLQGGFHPVGTFHVRCDIEAELMCFVACGFYIFRRHTKDTGFSDLFFYFRSSRRARL